MRCLSEAQLANLKQEARRQGIRVNRLVFQRLGSVKPGSNAAGEDPLLRLAGTWSEVDAVGFAAAIALLEEPDTTTDSGGRNAEPHAAAPPPHQ